jgi:hypothetical protein
MRLFGDFDGTARGYEEDEGAARQQFNEVFC